MPKTGAWMRAWAAGALLAASLIATSAGASVLVALDLPDLVSSADVIVLARAVSEQSLRDAHGNIVTDVEMVVEHTEKGGFAHGDSLVVRRLGGVIDGIGMRVEGEPGFAMGERTLLFGEGRGQTLRPIGMAQGVMRIVQTAGEDWVRSGAAGLSLLKRAPDGRLVKARAALPEARRLGDVLSEIRTLVAQSR